MKEAIVSPGGHVEVVDSPIPEPGPNQVVIKVVYSGMNPKDWKFPDWNNAKSNSGDDIAGYIHHTGANVTEFKPGDRVAAFHDMRTPHGSFAEYAVAWSHTTFHLPASTSFAQAATIPLAAMTAALGLFSALRIPTQPWSPTKETRKSSSNNDDGDDDAGPHPLVVYGGATAVGAFAIKLAAKANVHPIIAVAGRGREFVEGLLNKEKGDAVVDYRDGDEAVVRGIREALQGKKLYHVLDAVSENGSYINASKVLEKKKGGKDSGSKAGKIALVLPGGDYEDIPEGIEQIFVLVASVHDNEKDFGHVYFRAFARGLQEGWFTPHPYEVIPGGLGGVQTGLQKLKDGKASAVKYVFKISDTEGAEKDSNWEERARM